MRQHQGCLPSYVSLALSTNNKCIPYVSAYICAKERRVKHQCISVLANATLPFSGLKRRSGSGSIPLCRLYERNYLVKRNYYVRNDGVHFFDSMFDLIEGHLKKIGRNGLLPAGIFITGGGSNTHMIEELAKISLKLPSRIASIDVVDPKNKIKDSTWAVAYGLCILGFSKEGKKEIGVKTTLNQTKEKVFDWLKRFLP